jgi:hypothetical protein
MSSSSSTLARRTAILLGALSAVVGGTAHAATDLATVRAVPTRGQSPDQARRDRYECHNWAVEQTGTAPRRIDPAEEASAERERDVGRVLTGAGIGSTVGAIAGAGHDEDPLASIIAGGVIGAAVAAITGRGKKKDEPDPEAEEYLRALTACLEGRGYEVVIPEAQE